MSNQRCYRPLRSCTSIPASRAARGVKQRRREGIDRNGRGASQDPKQSSDADKLEEHHHHRLVEMSVSSPALQKEPPDMHAIEQTTKGETPVSPRHPLGTRGRCYRSCQFQQRPGDDDQKHSIEGYPSPTTPVISSVPVPEETQTL